MNETRTLARFVADTTFTDLPRRLVENLKITVLDTFGAALVGTRQPWAQRIVAVAKALGGRGRGVGPPSSLAHGRLACRARQRRARRRGRVRAAHGLACQRHRAAGGAGDLRARALRRRRLPHRPGPRLRSLGANRAYGRRPRDEI